MLFEDPVRVVDPDHGRFDRSDLPAMAADEHEPGVAPTVSRGMRANQGQAPYRFIAASPFVGFQHDGMRLGMLDHEQGEQQLVTGLWHRLGIQGFPQ